MLLLLIVSISLLTVNCDEKVIYKCVGLPRKKIMLDSIPVIDLRKLKGLKLSMSKLIAKKLAAMESEKTSIKTILINSESFSTTTTTFSFSDTITSKINSNQYSYNHHYNSSLIISDEILRILRQQALSILEHLDGPCFVENRSEILRFILLLDCVHNFYPQAKYDKFFIYDSSWLKEKYSSSSVELLNTFGGEYSPVEEREESGQYFEPISDKSYLMHLENMSKYFQEHHVHALLMVSSGQNLPQSILNYFNIFSFHQFHMTIPMKDAKNEKYIMIFTVFGDSTSAILCRKTSTDVQRNEIFTNLPECYFIFGFALMMMVFLILNYKENLYHIRCWILGNYMKERIILDYKKVKCDPYSAKNENGKTIYLGEYMEEKIYLVGQGLALNSKGDWSTLVQIRELRNDNLAMFKGLVKFENNPTMFMAWEFCVRGSLSDILLQPLIDLDWPFKLSLLMDLSNGLRYLHQSSVGKHGWLTSKDCLVDNKWLLKVGNFGLTKLYQQHGYRVFREDAMNLVWSAPEVIRAYSCENTLFWGSREGDVYSFAMIMSEVITGKLPFGINTRKQAEDLITDICQGFSFRPTIDNHGVPDEMINLMKTCWAESPFDRPRMKDVHETFRKHAVGRTLIDSMVQKLERYTTNLELLIEARTQELEEGRRMTESLLYRMLPVPVANSLRMGKIVEPEKFDEVTVYFSDIVGFTTIAAFSCPIEIITLLNDLYTCFDSVIDAYDVYKVETIGDAYMVVGGIPESNPDHAEQIATMALDILHHCSRFRIKHIPRAPLRLRIGIHSGPVVAGIVGQTMPRYCLFGNTVNLASRMESTSRPFRIHISKRTHKLLTRAGGYIMKYRGEIDLKGRGKKPTYWLLGKEGFGKELPQFSEEESPSHGFSDCEIMEIFGNAKISPDLSPASVTIVESESA